MDCIIAFMITVGQKYCCMYIMYLAAHMKVLLCLYGGGGLINECTCYWEKVCTCGVLNVYCTL